MIIVVVQARLDSSRLPAKALLDLGGKSIVYRVMETLLQVRADEYILACDTASEEILKPIAASIGFTCLAGDKENVLSRFCMVVEKTGASIVVRATADNPFLFSDAAQYALERFKELKREKPTLSYYTQTGLPHGSGVEILDARSLLRAEARSQSSYEREHVGPALYNHPEIYLCIKEAAEPKWYFPHARTTIDTKEDYERNSLMLVFLQRKEKNLPATSEEIIEAWNYVSRPIVFIPALGQGKGIGHFMRLASIVTELCDRWLTYIVIPEKNKDMIRLHEFRNDIVIHSLPSSIHLIVLDAFQTDETKMKHYLSIAPVLSIDEGGSGREGCDYLIDSIPSLHDYNHRPNQADPCFINLPHNRKKKSPDEILRVLVLAGGENAAGLALPIAQFLTLYNFDITVIDPNCTFLHNDSIGLTISPLVPDLRETLCHYDLVVSHYGLTAYEALAAGCRVILFSPTTLHYKLAKKYGFPTIPVHSVSHTLMEKLLKDCLSYIGPIHLDSVSRKLSIEVESVALSVSKSTAHFCPLCHSSIGGSVLHREKSRTIVSCAKCSITYMRFVMNNSHQYTKSYFFDEYQKQYGKTYLEDFAFIRTMGCARMAYISKTYNVTFTSTVKPEKTILDIGCAYGPFLDAARSFGWKPWGTDISHDAVEYVTNELRIPACVSSFPAFEPPHESFPHAQYSAVSLWYVIEHFQDIDSVFKKIRSLLISGGIVCFSTPSGSGISARLSRCSFYSNSPTDHFTIWNPSRVSSHLRRFGFKVKYIKSTGHHPERFPGMKNIKQGSFLWKCVYGVSRIFSLGDTFEVYAVKRGSLEDVV